MKNSKRRTIFVKKDFQGRLILGYFLFVAAGCSLFLVLFAALAAEPLVRLSDSSLPRFNEEPVHLLRMTFASHWPFFAFGALLLGYSAIRITHRIAGPLFNFERTLDQMLRRNLAREITLRNSDEGNELAVKINTFNTDLSRTLRMIGKQAEASAILLEQVRKTQLDAPENDELNSLLWALEEKNKKIGRLCNSYILRDE
jgi:methyl-accepting chemotaxis protein